jgi:hypothetical protein
MIDINGVGAGDTLTLTSRPVDGRGAVGTLSSTATRILVAGPSVEADGKWTPVGWGAEIGWIRNEFTIDNPTCPRTTPNAAVRSCIDIADGTIDVFKGIAANAAAIDAANDLALTTAHSGSHDSAISTLVEEAAASGCPAVELNALLIASRNQISTAGPLTTLVLRALYAQEFFVDS